MELKRSYLLIQGEKKLSGLTGGMIGPESDDVQGIEDTKLVTCIKGHNPIFIIPFINRRRPNSSFL